MKGKIVFTFFISILLACSGSDSGEDSTPIQENNAPSVPTLIFPSDNLLCIDNTLVFEWNPSTDDEEDAITYKIEISKDVQFASIEKSASLSTTTKTFTLEKGIAYYWRVEAIDSKNESSGFSSVFNLYTEGEGVSNHLPFSPELVKPLLGAKVPSGSITLEWKGSDTDGDDLTYDIYLDKVSPPVDMVSENQNGTTNLVNVEPRTKYYWQVTVKDENGGITIGQIWSFTTE